MKYDVTVFYHTKRSRIALSMEVDADNAEDAGDIARSRATKGYPARVWVATRVSEADA